MRAFLGALILIAGLVGAPGAAPPRVLRAGDPAPALEIAEWVRAGPARIEAGRVTVVAFVAPWCPVCDHASSVLGAVGEKYAPAGVSVIAITGADTRGADRRSVGRMAARRGAGAVYPIGFDDRHRTRSAWLIQAGRGVVPTVFVVARDERIAWIGNPLWPPGEFEDALGRVAGGAWDGAVAADVRASADGRARELEALADRAMELESAGRFREAVSALERCAQIDPWSAGSALLRIFEVLVGAGEGRAAMDAAKRAVEGPLRDDAESLNELAWTILTDPAIAARDLDVAFQAAKRAELLTDGQDCDILDTLARACHDRGDLEGAVSAQERAVGAATEEAQIADMRATLERYKAELDARR